MAKLDVQHILMKSDDAGRGLDGFVFWRGCYYGAALRKVPR